MEKTDGHRNKQMIGLIGGWMDGHAQWIRDGQMNKHMDRQMINKRMNDWVDELIGRWTNKQMGGAAMTHMHTGSD